MRLETISERRIMDNNRYLFLLSGAAGSGKSTLATKIQNLSKTYLDRPVMDICEADEFWYILGKGKYAFNPKLLWKAHKWCQDQVEENLKKGWNVAVANTNLTPRDRKPYFNLAEKYGYKVVYIHLTTQFQNQHNVPDDAVEKMRARYTDLTADERERVLKSDEMDNGLKELLRKAGIEYGY